MTPGAWDPVARNGRMSDLPLRAYRPVPRLHVAEHQVPRARFPVVDSHTHLGRWLTPGGGWMVRNVDALIELMDRCNVQTLVNLDGRWGHELADNLARYDHAHPGRFVTFCHVDWSELARPGFGDRLAASLAASVEAGASGLKVWKDVGLHVRDHDGRLVLADDPRLEPLWGTAADLDVPVAIHTADPVAFFDPIDERNERLEQLLAHPEWSFADPVFPRFERLIDALEALVAKNPKTTFIGVHAGCYPENLGWVSRMLDSYPNFHIDIAARIAELGRQPRATRDLILRHPDRVLFGTDEYPPDAELYAIHFRFLETADEHFAHTTSEVPLMGRWAIYGLDLPEDVLRKVCAGNAARVIPALARMRLKGASR
jgi:predicted TIM-barrel fold metal-dependent hydrolase